MRAKLQSVAVWKSSSVGSLVNSGDLEACGQRGFVSIGFNGQADESKLQQAVVDLVGKVIAN